MATTNPQTQLNSYLIAVCRQECLCCANRYDEHRARKQQCCSVGKCCRRTPSPRQIHYIHAVLRNALSNAERDEIVTRNVAKLVQIPAPRYKIGKGLPVHDVKRILVEAQHTRLYALYVLAATLGFRRGELLGLRWSDIDLNLGTITPAKTVQRVRGRLLVDDTKTEDSDNTIPLPKITRRVLVEHRNRLAIERADTGELWVEHGLVFPSRVGTPIEPRNLNRHFQGIRTRAGYPHVRLHDFRHTVVSLCSSSGHHRMSFSGSPGTPTSRSPWASTRTPTLTPCAKPWTASSGMTCEQPLLHGCYM
jgi:integrase